MINDIYNKVEFLRVYMLINSNTIGSLFLTLPIQENQNINDIEIKDYIFYFNSNYIENENFEDLIINISIKIIQFYFECNNNNVIYAFIVKMFYRKNIGKNKKWRYENNINDLVNNSLKINQKKSTIIYCMEKIQQCDKYSYNMNFYYKAIFNLPYDINLINQFNDININTNINSLIERCQFLFYTQHFSSLNDINIFFSQYVYNFSQFILFLFKIRYYFMTYHNIRNICSQFIYQHQSIFDIINIISNIDINSSFQNEKLNKVINDYLFNFSLI